jgi:hypothetical protein
MSIFQAIRNNNDGVRLMLEGKDNQAAKTFAGSLLKIKKLLDEDNVHELCAGYREQEKEIDAVPRPYHHIFHSEVEVPGPFHSTTDTAVDGGFVFQHAIVLSSPIEGCIRVDEQFLNTHSACSIFNVALLHHRLAISGSSFDCLQKAEHMYTMCIKLLQGVPVQLNNSCRTTLTVLMASQNNLSQIQLYLGSYSDARQSLQELSRLLCGAKQMFFSNEVWNGLLTNTLMLQAANVAPAA